MKKIKYIIIALFLGLSTVNAQIDRSQQPQPGPAPEIKLKDPLQFQLKNGLTVMLVENNKLPRVSATLAIDNPLVFEGDKAGVLSLLGSMMGKGSTSMEKDAFEEEIDFLGARLSMSSSGFYAGSLKRYFPRVLEMAADAALNPNFTTEEFDKEKAKILEGIKSGEKDVKTAARRVENLLSYGAKHPNGEFISKESVDAVTVEDMQLMYDRYYKPDNAYIVVIGDIDFNTVKKMVTDKFKGWSPGKVEKQSYPEPENIAETAINFVEMPNAVQSEIAVMNMASLDKLNPDYFPVIIANQILGGGGEARLFLNLREDKGFTYGSYSRFSDNHKTKARFRASTSVRNAVTDSAVVEILKEVNRLSEELVTDDELSLVKAKYTGSFVLGLEKPETVAQNALNIKTQNLPENFYKTFLQKINAVTKEDVQRIAKKYFLGNQARIVVTGKGSDVLEPLETIDYKGRTLKVSYFDKYGNPTERPEFSKVMPEGTTAKSVINSYLEAIGGKEKLAAVTTIQSISQASMQGMTLEIDSKKTNQTQMRTEVKMMGNVMQKQVVNSDKAYMEMQGQHIDMEGDQLTQMLLEAKIFPELSVDQEAISLVGLVDVDGVEAYEVKVSENTSNFYDAASFLKIKIVQTVEMMGNSQTNEMLVGDYKEVDGLLFPYKVSMTMGPQAVDFITQSIKLNAPIAAEVFD